MKKCDFFVSAKKDSPATRKLFERIIPAAKDTGIPGDTL